MFSKFLKLAIFFSLITFFSFANAEKVQDIFKDIDSNYKYLDELQALYDKGMIVADKEGKFNPQSLLNRDEFVGIAMHVICRECIVPNTPENLITKFQGIPPFYDVPSNNDYFYCIADAKENDYVRGYDNSYVCQDGTTKSGEAPFCIDNKITLEEAIAVLLRNSGIFTIADNQSIINEISTGVIKNKISNDVGPLNSDGSVYTFYGYLKKALEYTLVDYDNFGNRHEYKLLTPDSNGNINPKKNITKEEFLHLAYITVKANSCSLKNYAEEKQIDKFNLDAQILIYEEVCKDTKADFEKVNGRRGEYAFKGSPSGGTNSNFSYNWEFVNKETGQIMTRQGECVPNFKFPSNGEWKVNLYVVDDNSNIGKATSTLNVYDGSDEKSYINNGGPLNITVTGKPTSGSGPLDVDFTSLVTGGDGSYTYDWDFCGFGKSDLMNPSFIFNKIGKCEATLIVRDGSGKSGQVSVPIEVYDKGGLNVNINGNPLSGYGPLEVDFNSYVVGGDGNYTYNWNFGDNGTGSVSNEKNPTHIFAEPGIYEVILNVTDGNDETAIGTLIIRVLEGQACGANCSCPKGTICSSKVIGECSKTGVCLKDTDGDTIPDDEDKCPFIYGSTGNFGCPIISETCISNSDCRSGYTCAANGFCQPKSENTSYCNIPSTGSSVFGNMVCNSCPCSYELSFVSAIRKCDILFPAITSPNGKDIYSKGNEYQIPYEY